jgi:teichuronic acid exporter
LNKEFFNNTIWSTGGQMLNNVVLLICNIIYVRHLSSYEFGQVGIIMFFVIVSNVLIEGGFNGALIRRTKTSNIDFTTVFIFNFIVSIVIYITLVLNSNNISNFYNDADLSLLLIVISSVLIFNALNFVQLAKLTKSLDFRSLSIYNFISITFSNLVGVILLFCSYGIWSIVIARVLTPLSLSLILWTKVGGIGKLRFSISSFKSMFSFGINTTIASLLDSAFNNIYHVILGKFFSINAVGYFYQAKKLQDVPNGLVFSFTNSVLFASLSPLQEDQELINNTFKSLLRKFSIIIGFLTLCTLVLSKEIILILFGPEWIKSSYYLSILAASAFFYLHEIFFRALFKINDKTKIILKLELIKKALLSLSILLGVILLNLDLLLYGFLVVSILSLIISSIQITKTIKINLRKELVVISKIIISILGIILLFELISIYLNVTATRILFPVFLVVLYYFFLRLFGVQIQIKDIVKMVLKKINK